MCYCCKCNIIQRHKSSFQNRGLTGLLEELDMDIKRLSSRNLGRDDRYVMNQETDLYGTNIHVGSYMYFFLPNKTQIPPGAY